MSHEVEQPPCLSGQSLTKEPRSATWLPDGWSIIQGGGMARAPAKAPANRRLPRTSRVRSAEVDRLVALKSLRTRAKTAVLGNGFHGHLPFDFRVDPTEHLRLQCAGSVPIELRAPAFATGPAVFSAARGGTARDGVTTFCFFARVTPSSPRPPPLSAARATSPPPPPPPAAARGPRAPWPHRQPSDPPPTARSPAPTSRTPPT